jgi:hypothetical protein
MNSGFVIRNSYKKSVPHIVRELGDFYNMEATKARWCEYNNNHKNAILSSEFDLLDDVTTLRRRNHDVTSKQDSKNFHD